MQEASKKPLRKQELKTVSNSQLLTLIGSQLGVRPFLSFPHQIQQTSQGDIQLSFDSVPWNPFLAWLWSLANHYVVTFKQVTVNRTETAGLVKVLLVIEAK